MTIILRRPLTRQPQTLFAIDWSNPITLGLAFLYVASNRRLFNLVTGDAATISANTLFSVTPMGTSVSTSAQPNVASWKSVITTSSNDGLGDYTLLSFSNPVSESAASALFSQSAGVGLAQTYLLANTNSSYQAAAGVLTFGDSSFSSSLISVTGAIDGSPHVFIGGRQGTLYWLDVDGINRSASTLSQRAMYTAGLSVIFSSGINGYTNWTRSHRHALQAGWNRSLTASERIAVGVNPWQIFAPRRIIIPAGTAAAPTTFIPSWARQNSRVIGGGV